MPSGADVSLVSQRWLAAGCGLDEPSRRAIASAVLHELERTGAPTAAWIEQLYAFDPTLAPTHDDVHQLRAVLREVVAERAPAEDAPRLQHRVGIVVDDLVAATTQRRLAALEHTARVDPLTGLGNRRAGEEALERAIAHARRRERPLAVAMIDLDGLKRINDTEGHLAGDDALRRLGAALAEGMRTEDAAYRFGGDEFVVVAPETSAEDLRAVLDRIRRSSPSFSVGVAELSDDARDSAALLAIADADLYRGRRGEGAAATAARSRPRIDPVVPVLAIVVGLAAALTADVVRNLAGIEMDDNRWLWLAALAATPVVLVAGALRHPGARSTQVRQVLRSGGFAVVALVAALTPLVAGTIERRTSQPVGGRDLDRVASPPRTTTTTTTVVPDEADVLPDIADDEVAAPRDIGSALVARPATLLPLPLPLPTVRPAVPTVVTPPPAPSPTPSPTPTPDRPTSPAPDRPASPPAAPEDSTKSSRTTGKAFGPPRWSKADEHGRGAGPARARTRASSTRPPSGRSVRA